MFSDDDNVHEVIVISDPEIFNVSDDEAEVDPDVLEVGDESEPENDYEEDPEEMTDVEHEAPEPEVDLEVVVEEELEDPMEAEQEMEAGVPVKRRPSFRPYRLCPGGALFMYTPRKLILPPRKKKLVPAFGEENTVPPPPPKRVRAVDILRMMTPVMKNHPRPSRCEMYDHQLEAL
ncbi:hypothetical protein L1987_60170 [Smallanthus sonchifolius]|uniref:Uncharacterized protein n=1 Tax=Smallanthus sonchifolius TaxID=185202 RepID=A0ACB9D7J5_9ASTR|nr:hypothetical protein L1987_60170 [Smallanthus sonchifolius]